jgi:excisionase family DNA binding protein
MPTRHPEVTSVIRPAEHLVYTGSVAVIDGRICAMLDRLLNLNRVRTQVRGQNVELDQALVAIRLAGIAYDESASVGTVSAPPGEPVSQSKSQLNDTISTTEAAALLHMTRRAVSKECKQKRLPATLVGGRYRITRQDLAAFMAERRPETHTWM